MAGDWSEFLFADTEYGFDQLLYSDDRACVYILCGRFSEGFAASLNMILCESVSSLIFSCIITNEE